MSNNKKKQAENTRYVLKLREEDARIVCRACELFTRLHIGQLDELVFELMKYQEGDDDFSQKRDIAKSLLMSVRSLMFPELPPFAGASHSAGHTEQDGRAWNVYQVLRHAIAWNNHPEGGVTVDFAAPLNSAGFPPPECTIEKEAASEEA